MTKQSHPARFSPSLLPVLRRHLADVNGLICDPMGGPGGIYSIARPDQFTVCVDIEPEFAEAAADERRRASVPGMVYCGDSRDLATLTGGKMFDAIVTSPAYGNRLADGYRPTASCSSYAQSLKRPVDPANGGGLHWWPDQRGDRYRTLHAEIADAAVTSLCPGGRFVLNVSDFYKVLRTGEPSQRMRVVAWWVETLLTLGLDLYAFERVETPRLTRGENRHRFPYEVVASFTKPTDVERQVTSTTRKTTDRKARS
jgi:tRNA G10  N-methylase Trm11